MSTVTIEETRYPITFENENVEVVHGSPANLVDLADVDDTGVSAGKAPVYDGAVFDMVDVVTQAELDAGVDAHKVLLVPVTKVFADSPYTVAVTDDLILCNCAGGAITLNLPAASGKSGRTYTFKKVDSSGNAVTVDGNASETIDAGATITLGAQWEAVTIVCDGTNWLVVSWYAGTPL